MKLQIKKDKIKESYYLPPDLVEKLQILAKKLNYTKTQLVEIAIQNLLKENAEI